MHVLRLTWVVVAVATTRIVVTSARGLHHGGVAMGHINVCDDAKTQISMDWDPHSSEEYTCDEGLILPRPKKKSRLSCEQKTDDPIHVCYPNVLSYKKTPPTSGQHRPNWADYGEYRYVPAQRWLHDLEHGAVVMLYHPCADPAEIDRLRRVVTGCLRKHIITPYKQLPGETPFALLTWGCKLRMGRVDEAVAREFIMEHGKKDGPEGFLARKGLYNESLIVPARIVSDFDDSVICPGYPQQEGLLQTPWIDEGEEESEPSAVKDFSDHEVPPGDLPPEYHSLLDSAIINPIVYQSLQRRQWLDQEAEKMRESYRLMQRAFRQLVSNDDNN